MAVEFEPPARHVFQGCVKALQRCEEMRAGYSPPKLQNERQIQIPIDPLGPPSCHLINPLT